MFMRLIGFFLFLAAMTRSILLWHPVGVTAVRLLLKFSREMLRSCAKTRRKSRHSGLFDAGGCACHMEPANPAAGNRRKGIYVFQTIFLSALHARQRSCVTDSTCPCAISILV
jgi:hypothetical protein